MGLDPVRAVKDYLAGYDRGLKGGELACDVLRAQACIAVWVQPKTLVTHAGLFLPEHPPLPGDILFRWRKAHAVDVEVGCVLAAIEDRVAVIGPQGHDTWWLDSPALRGHLRLADLEPCGA